eukprot:jgi/Phyca11/506564/fgenesh2_kg.PHYCAscaffold_20_\
MTTSLKMQSQEEDSNRHSFLMMEVEKCLEAPPLFSHKYLVLSDVATPTLHWVGTTFEAESAHHPARNPER